MPSTSNSFPDRFFFGQLEKHQLTQGSPWLKKVKALYKASFPLSERKSFSTILDGVHKGIVDGYFWTIDDQVAALAFLIRGEPLDILDYLAVDPKFQSLGIGSCILDWLKKDHGLIVEIESSKDGDLQKSKRRSFYLKNGFIDRGIEISLFGVDMELLSTEPGLSFELYYDIFKNWFENTGFHNHFDLRKNIHLNL